MSAKPYYSVATNPFPDELHELGMSVLFAGESQTKPLHKLGPKVYDYYLLHHVLAGTGEFRTEQAAYALEAGDSFLIEPGRLVSYRADGEQPWRYCWAAFQGEQAESMIRLAGIDSRHPVIRGESSERKLVALFRGIMAQFRTRSRLSGMNAFANLHLIAATLGETRITSDPYANQTNIQQIVKQAVQHLTTQFAQNISMEQLAENLGYNRGYLSRIFRQATGMSPSRYLLKFRLEQSRRLLRERNELNIGQIASSVGFQDALYFSKQFRRFYGESPTAYRKSVLSGWNP